MKPKVVVTDKMQAGYRYALTAPMGGDFAPDFRPELTPAEMLRLGVFGGKKCRRRQRQALLHWAYDSRKL